MRKKYRITSTEKKYIELHPHYDTPKSTCNLTTRYQITPLLTDSQAFSFSISFPPSTLHTPPPHTSHPSITK